MTSYDVAAGASQAGLNALVGSLYADTKVRDGLFRGTVTHDVEQIGRVTLTYDVEAAPTFTLRKPTPEEWSAAHKMDKATPRPESNAFLVKLPKIAGSAAIAGGAPTKGEGEVTIVGQAVAGTGKASLVALALILDESSFSDLDKAIVNGLAIPELLRTADTLLAGLPLPTVPQVGGLAFQPLTLAVPEGGVVVGTSLSGGEAPDLDGFAFPPSDLFVLADVAVLDKLLAANAKSTYSEEGSAGSGAWKCAGRVTAKNLALSTSIVSGKVTLMVHGTFDAYGEVSGTGTGVVKALMCPIGTAVDAIVDPDNWDKVITDIRITYTPDPASIPITATAGTRSTSDGTQSVTISVTDKDLPSEVLLHFEPEWKGSVTGVALGAAASLFADLIPSVFSNIIVTKLITAYGTVPVTLPDMSTKLTLPNDIPVKATLSVKPGPAFVPHGTNEILQEVSLTIS